MSALEDIGELRALIDKHFKGYTSSGTMNRVYSLFERIRGELESQSAEIGRYKAELGTSMDALVGREKELDGARTRISELEGKMVEVAKNEKENIQEIKEVVQETAVTPTEVVTETVVVQEVPAT